MLEERRKSEERDGVYVYLLWTRRGVAGPKGCRVKVKANHSFLSLSFSFSRRFYYPLGVHDILSVIYLHESVSRVTELLIRVSSVTVFAREYSNFPAKRK